MDATFAGSLPDSERLPWRWPWSRWYPTQVWRLGAFFGLLVLRSLATGLVPLIPEEAYYWMYAQNGELSYYDHPPMVAWVIRLGTLLLGDNEIGVRLAGNAMMCGASVLLYAFARNWYGRSTALLSAAAIQVLPVFAGIGFVATMDSPLLFFWALGLLGATIALKHDRASGWYIAGFALGGAMLSKYTGIFLGLGAVLAVVGHRSWRKHLLSVHPYLASLLSLAIFSPVVIWNYRNNWASFRFQFVDRFEGQALGLNHVMPFMGIVVLVATPVLLIACAGVMLRCIRRPGRLRHGRLWLMFCFGLPLLAVMAAKSLRTSIHINWTLPAYLSLIPVACHTLVAVARLRSRHAFNRLRMNGLAWTFGCCIAANIIGFLYLLVLQPRTHLIRALGPWRELADVVERHEDELEAQVGYEPLILADGKYRLASILAFYRVSIEDQPTAPFTSNQWFVGDTGLGYAYWQNRDDWLGKTCLYLDDDGNVARDVRGRFDSFEVIEDPKLDALGYQLAICRGYRGPGKPRMQDR